MTDFKDYPTGNLFIYSPDRYQDHKQNVITFVLYDKTSLEQKGYLTLSYVDSDLKKYQHYFTDMTFKLWFRVYNERYSGDSSISTINIGTWIDLGLKPCAVIEPYPLPSETIKKIIDDFEDKFVNRFSNLFPKLNFNNL